MKDSIKTQIDQLKLLSKKQLKRKLIKYQILYLLDTKEFSFYWSLFFTLIPLVILNSGIITWFITLIFHYLIFWKYLIPLWDEKYDSEKDRAELQKLIEWIRSEL